MQFDVYFSTVPTFEPVSKCNSKRSLVGLGRSEYTGVTRLDLLLPSPSQIIIFLPKI